jgi:hypothetical protein
MYAFIYPLLHTYVHICILPSYAHSCSYMHTHAHTCTHMHTHAHTCTQRHTHVHRHTDTQMHTHACRYTQMHVHRNVHLKRAPVHTRTHTKKTYNDVSTAKHEYIVHFFCWGKEKGCTHAGYRRCACFLCSLSLGMCVPQSCAFARQPIASRNPALVARCASCFLWLLCHRVRLASREIHEGCVGNSTCTVQAQRRHTGALEATVH